METRPGTVTAPPAAVAACAAKTRRRNGTQMMAMFVISCPKLDPLRQRRNWARKWQARARH